MKCYGIMEYPNGANGRLIALFKSPQKAHNFCKKKQLKNHYCDYCVMPYEDLQIIDI